MEREREPKYRVSGRYGHTLVNVTPQEMAPGVGRLRSCLQACGWNVDSSSGSVSSNQSAVSRIRSEESRGAVDVCLAVIGKRVSLSFPRSSDEYPDGAGQCPHGQ